MTARRSAETPRCESRALQKARADLGTALLRAITELGLSQEGAARVIGVAKSTIGRWVRGEVGMSVEAVLASRIGDAFKRTLCTERHDSVPYIARARKRGAK